MARQKSFIRLDGSLGGLSFYKMEGKDVVRTPGGPSKEKIFHHPNFDITRRNISEFGAASIQAKRLRILVKPLLRAAKAGRVQAELSGIMREVCKLDTEGEFGKRSFFMQSSGPVLSGVELSMKNSFGQVFKGKFSVSPSSDRNACTISIVPFEVASTIELPAGATHFKFLSGMGVLSDLKYAASINGYQSVVANGNGIFVMEESPYIPKAGNCPGLNLETALPEGTVPGTESGVIQVLAIRFYQEVNGEYKPLHAGFGVRITAVY